MKNKKYNNINNKKLKNTINHYINNEKYNDIDGNIVILNKSITNFNSDKITSKFLPNFTFDQCEIKSSKFINKIFSSTKFNVVNFDNAIFSNSKFIDTIFLNSYFKNTNLTNANLKTVLFRGCAFDNKDIVNFQNSDCSNIVFRDCALSNIDFSNANLSNANFIASSIDLSSFYIDDAILTNTDFTGVIWHWEGFYISDLYNEKCKGGYLSKHSSEIDTKLGYIKSKGGKNIDTKYK